MNDFHPGTMIGRFVIREMIDACDVVLRYKVYDEDKNRTAALTLVDVVVTEEKVKGVDKVLSSLEALSHPHLAEMISTGYYNDRPYIIQRIVPGEMLRSRLGVSIAPMEAASYLVSAAEALAYMHEKGVVHGGITPDSIVLNAARRSIIIDAGIGALFAVLNISPPCEQKGDRWYYCAPETEQGKNDFRSDIFSMGAIYYELLGGQKPFSDIAQKMDKPSDLQLKERGIPWIAEQVALKALSPEPSDRLEHMGLLALALEDLSHEDQFSVRIQKWQKAMWYMLGVIVLILIILVLTRVV